MCKSAKKWVEVKSNKAFLHFLLNFCHIWRFLKQSGGGTLHFEKIIKCGLKNWLVQLDFNPLREPETQILGTWIHQYFASYIFNIKYCLLMNRVTIVLFFDSLYVCMYVSIVFYVSTLYRVSQMETHKSKPVLLPCF